MENTDLVRFLDRFVRMNEENRYKEHKNNKPSNGGFGVSGTLITIPEMNKKYVRTFVPYKLSNNYNIKLKWEGLFVDTYQ